MRDHKMTITFHFTQFYLPTKRHRNPRRRDMVTTKEVIVKELEDAEFPVAFLVKDHASLYKDAKDYEAFTDDKYLGYKIFTEEIRTFGGKLYRPIRVTHGTAISTSFEDPWDSARRTLNQAGERFKCEWDNAQFDPEKSIIQDDYRQEAEKELDEAAEGIIIFDNIRWIECSEPMYQYQTFGLGHNHGGTGFFISWNYNPNISKKRYFNALERDKAIEAAVKTAEGRGDTESVDSIKNTRQEIMVLMPEMVKRNPQKEHGDGDPFLNALYGLTENADSAAEAGILALAYTAAQIS